MGETAEAKPRRGGAAPALFAEGNHAYDAGAFGIAADRYGAAFAIKKTHDIAANLGAAELKLKRFAAAANHFAFAVRNHPPSSDAKRREALEAKLAEAKAQAVAITITAPARAEVLVDGVAVGTAPLADAYFAEPGEHRVEALLGERKGEASVRGAAAEAKAVEVVLSGSDGAAPAVRRTTPPSVPPDEAEDGLPLWPALVGGGASLVSVGVGIGLLVASGSAASDADELRAELAGASCSGSADPRCTELADAASAESTLGGAAIGMFVVGGVLAVGSAVYAAIAGSSGPTTHGTRVVPAIGPQLGGAVIGTF